MKKKENISDLESMLWLAQATMQSCSDNWERKWQQTVKKDCDNKEIKIFHQLRGNANKSLNICVSFSQLTHREADFYLSHWAISEFVKQKKHFEVIYFTPISPNKEGSFCLLCQKFIHSIPYQLLSLFQIESLHLYFEYE